MYSPVPLSNIGVPTSFVSEWGDSVGEAELLFKLSFLNIGYNHCYYILCMSRGVMSYFHALKSPARICLRASPTSQR